MKIVMELVSILLDNDPERIFNINPRTGVVTANGNLDREVKSKYVIEIYVSIQYRILYTLDT